MKNKKMNRIYVMLVCAAMFALFTNCTDDKDDTSSEDLFKEYVNKEEFNSTESFINDYLKSLNSDLSDAEKIEQLRVWLKAKDCIADVTTVCVSCVETNPSQSELLVSFLVNGNIKTRTLDISMSNPLKFAGYHGDNIIEIAFPEKSLGCSSFVVYKVNDENNIAIAVRGNREKLNLSTTEQTFNLYEMNEDELSIELLKFSGNASGYYCNDVVNDHGEIMSLWTAESGQVKIKITQDYANNISENPMDNLVYKISVSIENIILKDSLGNMLLIDQLAFTDVLVGTLPG